MSTTDTHGPSVGKGGYSGSWADWIGESIGGVERSTRRGQAREREREAAAYEYDEDEYGGGEYGGGRDEYGAGDYGGTRDDQRRSDFGGRQDDYDRSDYGGSRDSQDRSNVGGSRDNQGRSDFGGGRDDDSREDDGGARDEFDAEDDYQDGVDYAAEDDEDAEDLAAVEDEIDSGGGGFDASPGPGTEPEGNVGTPANSPQRARKVRPHPFPTSDPHWVPEPPPPSATPHPYTRPPARPRPSATYLPPAELEPRPRVEFDPPEEYEPRARSAAVARLHRSVPSHRRGGSSWEGGSIREWLAESRERWATPLLGVLGICAVVAAVAVQLNKSDSAPQAAAPAPTAQAAVVPDTTTQAPGPALPAATAPGECPTETAGSSIRGNGAGGKSSGPAAILALQHAYYVARSGALVRELVAPDASVPSAVDIQAGIDTVPPLTTHCVQITPGAFSGQYIVIVTEFRPDKSRRIWSPQLVMTTSTGDGTVITAIVPLADDATPQ